jgi:hypothetical protein
MKKISSSILMVIACVGISFAQQKTVIIKSDALVAPAAPVAPPAMVTPPVPPTPPAVVAGPAMQVKMIRIEKNRDGSSAPETMIIQSDSEPGANKQVKMIRIEKNRDGSNAPETIMSQSDSLIGAGKQVKMIRIEKNRDGSNAPETMIIQTDSLIGSGKQVKMIRIEKNNRMEGGAPSQMTITIDSTVDGKRQVKIIRMEKNGDRKMRAGKRMRRNDANENTVMIYSDGKVNIDSLIKLDTTQISILNKKIVIIGDQEIQQIYFEKDTLGDFFDHSEFNKEFKDFNKEFKGNKKNRSNGDRKSLKSAKKFKDDRGGLEFSIGYNAWLDNGSTALSLANSNLELINNKSTNVNLSYVNYFKIYKNFIQFSAGVGIDWNNYRFSKNITLSPKADSMNLVVDNINYSKNKLMAKYVTVPLQLHFATKPNKKGEMLGVAGGVELGYLLNGRQKQISEENGKQKIDDDYNLADLRLGYTLCANYGNTGIYAKYYPTSTFKESQGPNLNTFCIGFKFGLD